MADAGDGLRLEDLATKLREVAAEGEGDERESVLLQELEQLDLSLRAAFRGTAGLHGPGRSSSSDSSSSSTGSCGASEGGEAPGLDPDKVAAVQSFFQGTKIVGTGLTRRCGACLRAPCAAVLCKLCCHFPLRCCLFWCPVSRLAEKLRTIEMLFETGGVTGLETLVEEGDPEARGENPVTSAARQPATSTQALIRQDDKTQHTVRWRTAPEPHPGSALRSTGML